MCRANIALVSLAAALLAALPAYAVCVPVGRAQLAATQPEPLPAGADIVASRIRAHLSLQGLNWARAESARLRSGATPPEHARLDASVASIGGAFVPGISPNVDELLFVVLLEAAQGSDQDLHDIMQDAQKANTQKQSMRDAKSSEISDMNSMRLQTAMDRRSKLIEAMSNLMKAFAQTDSSIVKNIKP